MIQRPKARIGIIGGGAAGFFAALVAAELDKELEVIVFEKTRQPLAKVKISGGGRCNVTHSCFDPVSLSTYYPRGSDSLKKAFYTFQPQDMIDWLADRGVVLKVEADGRMFPMSNTSSTIVDCFMRQAQLLGVTIRLESEILRIEKNPQGLVLHMKDGQSVCCDAVLLATGGLQRSYLLAESVGHSVMPAVPSLFTFNIQDERIDGLSGVAVTPVKVHLQDTKIVAEGPLLITHWGISGPAVLRLSAWGARHLAERGYEGVVVVNWVPLLSEQQVRTALMECKVESASKIIHLTPLFGLPKNLWKKLLSYIHISETKVWAHFSKTDLHELVQVLCNSQLRIQGKSTNKDEFVTCGGIPWKEINPKTMESKLCTGLYFAGEVVDTDGITGGFNFQNAWTTAWIAAHGMTEQIRS
jgi:predicted Rossmann fold flavoprotein